MMKHEANAPVLRRLKGIAVGLITILIMLIIRQAVETHYTAVLPFSMFFISVILAAWWGGFISGLCATGLSIVAYFFVGHAPPDSTRSFDTVLRTVIYALDGCLISFVCASLQSESAKRAKLESSANAVEIKYKDLVDSVDHAVIWSAGSNDLAFSFVSPRTKMITGYSAEEWMSEPGFFLNHVPTEDRPEVLKLIADVWKGDDRGIEHRFRHKSGRIVWFHTGMRRAQRGEGVGYEIRGLSTDVTRIMEAEKRAKDSVEILRESDAELRTLANSVPLLAWMAHSDGHIFWYNDRWYEYSGTMPKDMEGWGWQSIHHPDHLAGVMERWTQSISTGSPFEMTFPLKSKSGEFRSFLTRVVPIRNPAGEVVRWYGTNTDVEETYAAELRAKENEESLTFALASAHMGSWSIDLVNQMATFSNEARRILGASESGIWIDGGIEKYVHPEDRIRAMQDLSDALASRTPYDSTFRTVRDSGGVSWIRSRGRVQYGSDGQAVRLTGLITDITEAKVREMELVHSQTHLRVAIDSSAGGFYGVDTNGVTTVCNNAFLEMLGFEKTEDAVGHKLHDVIHHTHPDGRHYLKEECPIYQAAQTGKASHVIDELFYRLDGTSFPVEYWVLPLIYDGKIQGAVTTFIDITERKATELALKTAKDEAERANELKSAFLANMSHEIRTPLGAMMGFADLMRDPGISPTERASFIDVMIRNGESLSVIINDILDLSKVEAGHLTLEFSDFSPAAICAEVVSLLQVTAKDKDLVIEFEIEPSAPVLITSDPTRVRQILLNLVGNAIKFTQFGSVRLRGYGCQNHDGLNAFCFEVTDTGIGIEAAQLPRMFEMFVQADGSMTRRFGGTGLGLALSRRLARAMGGDVTIERTVEGVGTTFLARIEDQPTKRNSTASVRGEKDVSLLVSDERALEGLRILVVDDAPDNQQLIWRYLTKQGAIVESAENGLVGYRTALAGRFDIVLMDIQMPVMDGYSATAKLRENRYLKPIIALTAHAMTDVKNKALNVGYTDHLPKPINPRQLVSTILRHTRNLSQ